MRPCCCLPCPERHSENPFGWYFSPCKDQLHEPPSALALCRGQSTGLRKWRASKDGLLWGLHLPLPQLPGLYQGWWQQSLPHCHVRIKERRNIRGLVQIRFLPSLAGL